PGTPECRQPQGDRSHGPARGQRWLATRQKGPVCQSDVSRSAGGLAEPDRGPAAPYERSKPACKTSHPPGAGKEINDGSTTAFLDRALPAAGPYSGTMGAATLFCGWLSRWHLWALPALGHLLY